MYIGECPYAKRAKGKYLVFELILLLQGRSYKRSSCFLSMNFR